MGSEGVEPSRIGLKGRYAFHYITIPKLSETLVTLALLVEDEGVEPLSRSIPFTAEPNLPGS